MSVVDVLDTDHIGVLQRASGPSYQALSRRISQFAQSSFYVSTVSFDEQKRGWNAYIARARDSAGVVRGYARLNGILHDFSHAQVLSFDDRAAAIADSLRQQRIRVGIVRRF